jgi:hypothetical protein
MYLSLTLKEEHIVRVFENKMSRKIFWAIEEGSKRTHRKLHSCIMRNFMICTSPNTIQYYEYKYYDQINEGEMSGMCGTYG